MSLSTSRSFLKGVFGERRCITPLVLKRGYDIPCHLVKIGSDPNPSFYRMVEYFYHYAVKVCEPALVEYLKKHTRKKMGPDKVSIQE